MAITKEYQDKFRANWTGTPDEFINHLEFKIRQMSVIMDGMELDYIHLEKERDFYALWYARSVVNQGLKTTPQRKQNIQKECRSNPLTHG